MGAAVNRSPLAQWAPPVGSGEFGLYAGKVFWKAA